MELIKENKVVSHEKIEIPDGIYYGYVDDTNDNDAHRYYEIFVNEDSANILSVVFAGSDLSIRKFTEYAFGWHTEKIFINHPKARFITKEEFLQKHKEAYALLNTSNNDATERSKAKNKPHG